MQKMKMTVVLGLAAVALMMTGCRSAKFDMWENQAGIQGSEFGGFGESGDVPMADRESKYFRGTPHRGEFDSVYFAYDSYQIAPSERAKAEAVAAKLKSDRNAGVIVEGHCDERGSRDYNLALGERRALAVREYLVGLGVSPERIQTRSFGEENPAVPGHDESVWSKNRRGEFVLYY